MFSLFFCAFILVLTAQEEKAEKESLRGLEEIRVDVRAPKGNPQAESLLAHQIEVDVGVLLLRAGIRMVLLEGWQHQPGGPFLWPQPPKVPTLYVQVKPQKPEGDPVYSVSIEVKREDPETRTLVLLWHLGSRETGGVEKEEGVRKKVIEYVEAFIKDYRAVNPR